MNRIEVTGKSDPLKTAQKYTDWARRNLDQFAKATFELMRVVSDSRAEDELLSRGFELLKARQAIGGRRG